MDSAPVAASTTSVSASTLQSQPSPMIRSYVLSTAAGSCFVALLAVAFTIVWRRKQRWRRTRPWIAKLRAETASKIEKEREKERVTVVEHKESSHPTPKGKEKETEKVVAPPTALDNRSDAGKRSKERRKRGKDAKPAARNVAAAPVGRDAPTPKPEPLALVEEPMTIPPRPLSPHLIPLPSSPSLNTTPTKLIPPALVLSGPASPVSTSMSMSATATELTATTPTTSTSVSPAPASPAFNGSETTTARAKLPAFPPASPLPPTLARKAPPLMRRPTPAAAGASTSTSTPMPNISRKDSHAADRRKESSRKGTVNEESDGPVDDIEFPTLSPWPVVGKPAETGRRRERETSGRKASDAGRGRKPSDARKKAGAGGATNPESTQLASLRGALEAARLREEEVTEERRAWAKKERELQIQINQLAHQLQLATMFGGGGMQAYPGYGYGYGPMPPTPGPGPMPPTPGQGLQPQSTPSEAASSKQTSPTSTPAPAPSTPASVPGTPASQPYPPMYLPFPPQFPMFAPPQPHGSPMPLHGSPMPSPMPIHSQPSMAGPSQPPMPMMMSPPYGPMSPPQSHPYPWRIGTPNSGVMTPNMNGMMMHPAPIPSRRPTGFFAGSPRGGSRSRSPFVHPPQRRHGTPSSTPSVGSSADIGGLGSSADAGSVGSSADIVGLGSSADIGGLDIGDPFKVVLPPMSLKREREPDYDEESSSEDSDYDEEDSDDDSVIFEDGSVSDSVNLSLHGESKEQEPDLVSLPIDIRIGDDTS